MSVFNPEFGEFSEAGFEKKKFSPDMETRILKALGEGKETFPDIVQCPNKGCGNPLTVRIRGGEAHLSCPGCGWKHVVAITKPAN